ncbi:hypothetical protein GC175_04285 [bacterium]|nr:hypothetical protein [bacterium]
MVSKQPLSALCAEFERSCHILYHERNEDGNWQAVIEAGKEGSESAAEDITALLIAIAGLSSEGQIQWGECERREFDLGFDVGETWTFKHEVPSLLVQGIAAVGCSFVVTIYSSSPDSE